MAENQFCGVVTRDKFGNNVIRIVPLRLQSLAHLLIEDHDLALEPSVLHILRSVLSILYVSRYTPANHP